MLFSKKQESILPLYLIKKSWYSDGKYYKNNYLKKKNNFKYMLTNNLHPNNLIKHINVPTFRKYNYLRYLPKIVMNKKLLHTGKKYYKRFFYQKKFEKKYN